MSRGFRKAKAEWIPLSDFADVYEIVWNVQGKILWYIVKLGANKSGESLQKGA